MNWQLIDNVPPPKNRLLLVAFEDDNHHRIITKEAPCFNKGRNSCNDLGR